MSNYDQQRAEIEARFDKQIMEATSAFDRRDLITQKERALIALGEGAAWKSPHYSAEAAAMTDDELAESINKGMANARPGLHDPKTIRARQAGYVGDTPIAPEDVDAALAECRTPAQIANVMKRAGLSGDIR